ncbi:MerR family transcriptional regulator [Falsibacillus albus]|uniref:MerR family transcriptional regulator n=1 Tax=Falsibacillus albus TaxID=2478915 RepID=A0A3L7JS86_9BACI|nr:MerR family transcriptional regulator [Falsibacillus albus]RLQ93184.1 MerR family transcriptional regulator [Falsibacillus albus]
MEHFKIDDVSKMTGLTKRAIRYYEEIDLIDPPERTDGGTRLYTNKDIDRLKKVVLAKDVLGFSLQELQQFLKLNETIELRRKEYTASQETKKLDELRKIYSGLEQEMALIDQKIEKMLSFRNEIEVHHKKIGSILDKEAEEG